MGKEKAVPDRADLAVGGLGGGHLWGGVTGLSGKYFGGRISKISLDLFVKM